MKRKQIEHKAKEIADYWQEPSDYNIARDAATEMAEWLLGEISECLSKLKEGGEKK